MSHAVLFLDEKNQKSRQQNASLPHLAFALQIGQNHRAAPSIPATHPQAYASDRSQCPFPRTGLHVLPDFTRKRFAAGWRSIAKTNDV